MSPKEDPLSGEHDDEKSKIPGAPFIHQTPPPPKLQIGMTEGQKRRALRRLKYNEKRAAEGLVSAQMRIEHIQKSNKEGAVFGSVEDALQRVAVKFFERQPTDIEIEQVRTFIRRSVGGKLDISLEQAIDAYYSLAMKMPEKFEEIRAEFSASL